jgi:hypothetical protein
MGIIDNKIKIVWFIKTRDSWVQQIKSQIQHKKEMIFFTCLYIKARLKKNYDGNEHFFKWIEATSKHAHLSNNKDLDVDFGN